jgi:macrolide transport system ATP-binding/permease protein
MNELAIKVSNVSIEFNAKTILKIEEMAVYQNEKIAIIGSNGQGKTTLLNLLAGELKVEGQVERHIEFEYFKQIDKSLVLNENFSFELASQFNIPTDISCSLSGGESQKFRLTTTLSRYHTGLLLDEPTTHLDNHGKEKLISELKYYYGTLLFVSHDRYFINQIADKVWEVSDGKVTEYLGNYNDYEEKKKLEQQTQIAAFENYQKQKVRLEETLYKKKSQAEKSAHISNKQKNRHIKPSRLSGSKQKDTVQKNLYKSAKAVESRINHLDIVESPKMERKIVFPLKDSLEMHNKFPIRGEKVTLKKDQKLLLNNVDFQFSLGSKIALIGPNGSGKTSLFEHIKNDGKGIILSQRAKISMYGQLDYQLDQQKSLLEYARTVSDYNEHLITSILTKLGFDFSDFKKKVNKLSGGEATRLTLALTFLKPSNVLLLDEPTNFIDIATILALEELIDTYPGTVIFTSHDEVFTEKIADVCYEIKDMQLLSTSLK